MTEKPKPLYGEDELNEALKVVYNRRNAGHDMTRSAQNAKRSTQPTPAQPVNTNPLPSYIPSTPQEIAYERARAAAQALAQRAHNAAMKAAKILSKPAHKA